MSAGFWTPFLSTLGVLLLGLLLLRSGRWPLARFRSTASRRVSQLTGALLVLAAVCFLPYGMNLCRGGLDDPLDCVLLPQGLAELWSGASVLGIYALLVIAPVGFVLILLLELIARLR